MYFGKSDLPAEVYLKLITLKSKNNLININDTVLYLILFILIVHLAST